MIAFDMDGVLANFTLALLNKMSQSYNLSHLVTPDTYNQLSHPKVLKNFPQEYEEQIKQIINSPGFFYDMPTIPHGLEILRKVIDSGYTIAICTSPSQINPLCQVEKTQWLHKHVYPLLKDHENWEVIFTHEKGKYPFYTLIDDNMYYDQFTNGKLNWIPITFAQPWNTNDPNPLRMTENNYIEILAKIGIILQ